MNKRPPFLPFFPRARIRCRVAAGKRLFVVACGEVCGEVGVLVVLVSCCEDRFCCKFEFVGVVLLEVEIEKAAGPTVGDLLLVVTT